VFAFSLFHVDGVCHSEGDEFHLELAFFCKMSSFFWTMTKLFLVVLTKCAATCPLQNNAYGGRYALL
jgi:hypothetical protein